MSQFSIHNIQQINHLRGLQLPFLHAQRQQAKNTTTEAADDFFSSTHLHFRSRLHFLILAVASPFHHRLNPLSVSSALLSGREEIIVVLIRPSHVGHFPHDHISLSWLVRARVRVRVRDRVRVRAWVRVWVSVRVNLCLLLESVVLASGAVVEVILNVPSELVCGVVFIANI